jgi:septum site-determining protein MinC
MANAMLKRDDWMTDSVAIKGMREGLLVALSGENWDACLEALRARLQQNEAFFRGGRVALDVGDNVLKVGDIEALRELLAEHDVRLWALVTTSSVTRAAIQEMDRIVELQVAMTEPDASHQLREDVVLDSLAVRKTLRSGQVLRHPGHITVIGDVNPGAEIIAGGDIVVWGRVSGVVHAGAMGDEGAVICALDLAATQLRIAGHIARPPERRRGRRVPEMASVRLGKIEAAPWRG